jgi:hypothetical protein
VCNREGGITTIGLEKTGRSWSEERDLGSGSLKIFSGIPITRGRCWMNNAIFGSGVRGQASIYLFISIYISYMHVYMCAYIHICVYYIYKHTHICTFTLKIQDMVFGK